MMRGRLACNRVIALLLAAAAVACRPREMPPPPPPAAPTPISGIYYEEDLRPVEQPQIEIVDLQETPSTDGKRVTVTGTLINRGTKATSELSVVVDAFDADGNLLESAGALPSTERVAPTGTAIFTATFNDARGIARYHVEAIAR
jgi:hypothetical protein